MKTTLAGAEGGDSPYSAKTVDTAIQHLELVLSSDSVNTVLTQHYWSGRVKQIECTYGLTPGQRARVALLLKRLEIAFSAHREDGKAVPAPRERLRSKW